MADGIVRSLGHHGHWGFSATFDFIEAIDNTTNVGASTEPINILLVSPGDIRHIIYTISRRRRHRSGTRPIHFYIIDHPIEILARNLLMLEVMLDFEVPIRQRANVFLEIYGNVRVQERTGRYIEQLGQKLRSLVADGSSTLGLVSLEHLKYRERDVLESVFKSYLRQDDFDMLTLRDHRLRGHYQERYDNRKSLGDWDYQYSIKDSASIIHIKLFREWRESGIAFEFGDQTYDEGNRTMATYVEGKLKEGLEKGHHKEIKGFWGDIVGSPYYGFGIDADTRTPANNEAEGLFEIMNKNSGSEQHRHHACEVAVFNLFCMLWEAETGDPYHMTKKNDIYSGLGKEARSLYAAPEEDKKDIYDILEGDDEDEEGDDNDRPVVEELSDIDEEEKSPLPPPPPTVVSEEIIQQVEVNSEIKDKEQEAEDFAKEIRRAECIVETYRDVVVYPLLGVPAEILKKSKYSNKFDGMFVSSRAAQFCSLPLADEILKQDGLVVMETGKFVIPLLRKDKEAFALKLKEYAGERGWKHHLTAPVPRRYRDANDLLSDTLFYSKTK